MKGDVWMSPHEKGREQEDAHPKTGSHSTPPLHLCFSLCIIYLMSIWTEIHGKPLRAKPSAHTAHGGQARSATCPFITEKLPRYAAASYKSLNEISETKRYFDVEYTVCIYHGILRRWPACVRRTTGFRPAAGAASDQLLTPAPSGVQSTTASGHWVARCILAVTSSKGTCHYVKNVWNLFRVRHAW